MPSRRSPASTTSAAAPTLAPAAQAVLALTQQAHAQLTGRVPGATVASALALLEQADAQWLAAASKADSDFSVVAEWHFMRLYAALAGNSEQLPDDFDCTVQACQAAGPAAAHRLSAAWALLAFWHGVRNQFDGLCRAAKQALALAAPTHHLALIYAHMALAGALHWIGEYERTAAHFGPALVAARASGDAALNLFVQRQLALSQAKEARYLWSTGAVSIHALTQAEADLRGALQLTAALAPSNPATFLNIFLGEVLALQGQHAKALALLDQHEGTAAGLPMWPLVAISAARRSHCLLALAQPSAALQASETSQSAAAQQPDTEVSALVAAARVQVLQALGHTAQAAAEEATRQAAHAQWLALRQQHRDELLHALDAGAGMASKAFAKTANESRASKA